MNSTPESDFRLAPREDREPEWRLKGKAADLLPARLAHNMDRLRSDQRLTLADMIGTNKRLVIRLGKVKPHLKKLPAHEQYLAIECAKDYVVCSLMAEAAAVLLADTPSGAWWWRYIMALWTRSLKMKAERSKTLVEWFAKAESPQNPLDLL